MTLATPTLPSLLRAGVGLKPAHYRTILEQAPRVGFFEVHAENFMGAGGPPHRYLTDIRSRYELTVHGVGLSLGGTLPLDRAHLGRLRDLVERYEPAIVSEHLAWSSHEAGYFADLLPIPYNLETLSDVGARVQQVQDTLGRRILIENPSTYLRHARSVLTEAEFLAALVDLTGCGLLLDLNNLYVSAINHEVAPASLLSHFPIEHVGQIHLAGHERERDEHGRPLLIDTHDRTVCDEVWALYARTIERAGPVPTLIEWDARVPTWAALQAEATRADAVMDAALRRREGSALASA